MYQKRLHLPIHPLLAVPRNGRKWSAPCLLFLGMLQSLLPLDHISGDTRFLHRQAPPMGKRVQSLPCQVDQSSGSKRQRFRGPIPFMSPLNTPFVYSFRHLWSTLFLDPEHSTAPHCRQDSDFRLSFPVPPNHVSLCSSHTPVSLVPPFPPNEPFPFLNASVLLPCLLFSSLTFLRSGWLMCHLLHEAFLDLPTPQWDLCMVQCILHPLRCLRANSLHGSSTSGNTIKGQTNWTDSSFQS